MKTGWIYILTNPSMRDLIKVGLTTTSPEQRLRELSSATGVAQKFVLYTTFEVSDVDAAEAKAHRILGQLYGRPNNSREFFSADPSDAEEVLRGALQEFFVSGENLVLKDAELKIRTKSFTIGCAEFEAEFKNESLSLSNVNPKLASYFGAYIAGCAVVDRSPFAPELLSGVFSNQIMKNAISIAAEFTNEPEDLIISFVRRHRR